MPDRSHKIASKYAAKRNRKKTKVPIQSAVVQESIADASPVVPEPAIPVDTDNKSDYQYVIRDLWRMGLLIGGMMIILVVLALTLQ